ncbi:MAG TPA: hypothetical protein VF596_06815 [Pyrinomonadaceae bacterium]|jgi:1-aminocyclopropane-1-carboxylate deaminase/D-cysteine desulfhydrase-like pyridoxal-dependent ACC family enzyme
MLEVTVSTEHEKQLQQLAAREGKDVGSFAAELLEEKIEEAYRQNGNAEKNEEMPKERRYMRMKGMFSSGRTDTSERLKELLREEDFDPTEGFSIR